MRQLMSIKDQIRSAKSLRELEALAARTKSIDCQGASPKTRRQWERLIKARRLHLLDEIAKVS